MTITAIDPQPLACTLDGDELASVLVRLALASAGMGHQHPRSTILDYGHAVTSPEALFVRDMFTLTTPEICDRWFGGIDNARRTATQIRAARVLSAPSPLVDEPPKEQ